MFKHQDYDWTKKICYSIWINLKCLRLRGIGKTCTEAKTNGYKRLVGSSGGNAGLAMAYAAHQLEMPLTLFIPKVCSSLFSKQMANFKEC